MSNTSLATLTDIRSMLIPIDANKDVKSRVGLFCDWMTQNGHNWQNPALAQYRDHLAQRYNPATVSAHLSTIRASYNRLLRDNVVRDMLYSQAGDELARLGHKDDPANRAAFVNESYARLRNEIDPKSSSVKVDKAQDVADSEHIRLTPDQAQALLNAPGTVPVDRLRDTALIGILLTTGIREGELIALTVDDLRQTLNGELSLRVTHGKGNKKRLIPYGEYSWVLAIVNRWLEVAGISAPDEKVFRAFRNNGKTVKDDLSIRAVADILAQYPVMNDEGNLITVKPHDCRRTYARMQYDSGMDMLAISQNLGHESIETTKIYIGNLDAKQRRARGAISFDMRHLTKRKTE
jgi:site-specific recombinase XerD